MALITIVRHAIKIGYDGKYFNGFATQPDKKTVEGEILKRLIKSKLINGRKDARFQYAARTDKGVSAFGNVIAFDSKGNPLKVLDSMENIWITGYASVDKNFNPRYARYRIYRYYLINKGYDIKKMRMAAKLMEGEHDFSNFSKRDGRKTIRKLDKIIIKGRKILKIDFFAPSFLWNQVRRMVAALVMVGRGEAGVDSIKNALNGKRTNFGIMPSKNLVLLDVVYENVDFEPRVPDEIIIKREIYKDASNYLHASHTWNVGNTTAMEKIY